MPISVNLLDGIRQPTLLGKKLPKALASCLHRCSGLMFDMRTDHRPRPPERAPRESGNWGLHLGALFPQNYKNVILGEGVAGAPLHPVAGTGPVQRFRPRS